MPPAAEQRAESRGGPDFRPAGAVAGASLPLKSLLDYIRHDYPAYKKLLEAAEDATTADGNVDIAKVLKKVKPGDYGISGLQGSADPFTNTLVHGSFAASGGPGAHGQIAGPNVKVDPKYSRTPKGEMPPDLAYLSNDAGDLFSDLQAKNPEKFRKAITRGKENVDDWVDDGMAGTDTYGNLKERLRARSKQLADIRARQKAWDAYDKSTSNAKPPKFARPSAKELAYAEKLRTSSVKKFKGFLGDDKLKEFFEPKTPAGKADDFLSSVRSDITSRHPAAMAAAENAKRQRLKALAAMFGEKGTSSPRMKALSEDLLRQVDNVGVPGPIPARSRLFKPKQFETFVPSVLHGGMNPGTNRTNMTPLEYIGFRGLDFEDGPFSRAQWRAYKKDPSVGYGFSTMLRELREQPANYARDVARNRQRPGDMYAHTADHLYRHTTAEGSKLHPGGYYFGPKGTLWLRSKTPVDPAALEAMLKAEGVKGYGIGNAALGAIGEITGLSNLAKYVPGFNKVVNTDRCNGHMCGSFPATIYEALGKTKSKFPNAITLPNRVAISGAFEPVVATNKQLLLKQLRMAGGRRALLGLGAAGLMGAGGYKATGALQNAVNSAAAFVPPTPAPRLPAAAPSGLSNFKALGKYAPLAALGAGSVGALAAAHAWGKSRRKKSPDKELSVAPA